MTPVPSGALSSVKRQLTPGSLRKVTENDEYAAFLRRVLRAYGRRIAAGDIDALVDMAAMAEELEGAMRLAVVGLRRAGYSWGEIAVRLGITRQGAQQRWGSGLRAILPRSGSAAQARWPLRPSPTRRSAHVNSERALLYSRLPVGLYAAMLADSVNLDANDGQ
jgi:hypothetical protein